MARGQRCGLLAVLAAAPLAGATTCATPVDLSAYSVLTGESASTPQRAVFSRAPSFSLYESSEQTIFIESVVESWPKRSLDAFGNKLTIDTSG